MQTGMTTDFVIPYCLSQAVQGAVLTHRLQLASTTAELMVVPPRSAGSVPEAWAVSLNTACSGLVITETGGVAAFKARLGI